MNTKIDGVGNVPGALRVDAQPRRAGSAEEQAVEAVNPSTALKLSNDSVELRAARQSQPSEPSFDAARVERLRALVEAGEYAMNPQAIASRLMEIEGSLK
jgi:negative regulator of flagellin synthesis FlgM